MAKTPAADDCGLNMGVIFELGENIDHLRVGDNYIRCGRESCQCSIVVQEQSQLFDAGNAVDSDLRADQDDAPPPSSKGLILRLKMASQV